LQMLLVSLSEDALKYMKQDLATFMTLILRGAELTRKKPLQGEKKPHQNRCGL
jgi:hypothetical protein